MIFRCKGISPKDYNFVFGLKNLKKSPNDPFSSINQRLVQTKQTDTPMARHPKSIFHLAIGDYFTTTFVFTSSTNVFAGLKEGMLCAGMMIVVFLEMFLPVFSALSFTIKLPNPLR